LAKDQNIDLRPWLSFFLALFFFLLPSILRACQNEPTNQKRKKEGELMASASGCRLRMEEKLLKDEGLSGASD